MEYDGVYRTKRGGVDGTVWRDEEEKWKDELVVEEEAVGAVLSNYVNRISFS